MSPISGAALMTSTLIQSHLVTLRILITISERDLYHKLDYQPGEIAEIEAQFTDGKADCTSRVCLIATRFKVSPVSRALCTKLVSALPRSSAVRTGPSCSKPD